MKKAIATLSAVTFLTIAALSEATATEIKIGTGETAMATVLSHVISPFEKSSGMKLQYMKIGSGRAFVELAKNNVDVITSDTSLADLIEKAKKEGVDPGPPGQYQSVSLVKFRIGVIVNRDNSVAALSKEQLASIFSGKITNWKDVGGKDLPILIVWNRLSEGANHLFMKSVLDKTPLVAEKLETDRNEDLRQNVALAPEAIAPIPAGMIDASVKGIQVPEVSKEIVMMTKGKPSPQVQRLLDFVLGDGKKLYDK